MPRPLAKAWPSLVALVPGIVKDDNGEDAVGWLLDGVGSKISVV